MKYIPTVMKRELSVDSIISIHYFEYTPEFFFPGESHNCWEIVYCDKGELTAYAGGDRQILYEGQAYLHPPYQFHRIETRKSSANSVIIAFESDCKELYGISDKILNTDRHTVEALFSILREGAVSFENTPGRVYDPQLKRKKSPELFASEQVIQIYIELLLIDLIRQSRETRNVSSSITPPLVRREGLISEIVEYMNKNLSEKITFPMITERFSISSTTLKKLFKKNMNCGAMEYLNELRIAKSKVLLREGLSCTEISQRCGFCSIHHFSKNFKESLGMSPTEYVKSVKSLLEEPNEEDQFIFLDTK
jgi:AraC-like DNA-binding protein